MIFALASGVFIVGVLVYVLFMIFLPEWVGITGKTARNNQRSHEGEDVEPDQLSKFLDDKD